MPRGQSAGLIDPGAADEINFVVELVATVRSVRAETNIPAAVEAEIVVVAPSRDQRVWLSTHDAAVRRLARGAAISIAEVAPPNAAQAVVGDVVVCLPLAGLIDLDAERSRLIKELSRVEGDIAKIEGRLSNPKFLEKADSDTVDEQRDKRDDAEARLEKLRAALDRLDPVV